MKVSEDLELFVPPSDATLALLELLCCLWILQQHQSALQLHTRFLRQGVGGLQNYVDNLLDLIFHEVFQDPAPYVNEVLKISKPEDLSA
ncbi:unnamed protein product [Pleuronectes platessa]|uniref:Uncharacterized protein n=1 Tax=Pleuronectes platessa TaxID=8262 RepID=A0A9N7UY79_PLEPL|nr:unnamed protein product [Pleuronectes platessa]